MFKAVTDNVFDERVGAAVTDKFGRVWNRYRVFDENMRGKNVWMIGGSGRREQFGSKFDLDLTYGPIAFANQV